MPRLAGIRRIARVVSVPLAALAILIAGFIMFQDRLLYVPTHMTLDEVELEARRLGARLWPEVGRRHRGLLVEPVEGPIGGTVIVFHGNAGAASDRIHWADALRRLGWRTVLAEYPGYGAREGELGERSFVADGVETLRLVRTEFDGPVVLAGESLGAGVVGAVAAEADGEVDGVLLVTPWADLPSLAKEKFPLLPVGLILRDRYDTIANLGGRGIPAAVCIAAKDDVIPPHHSDRLFAALSLPKRCWVFPESGHNDWPIGAGEPWWAEVIEFLVPDPTVPR